MGQKKETNLFYLILGKVGPFWSFFLFLFLLFVFWLGLAVFMRVRCCWGGTKLLFFLLFLYSSFSWLIGGPGRLRYDWDSAKSKVYQALDQSIDFHTKLNNKRNHSAFDFLRKHLKNLQAVWIVDGKLYVHKRFLEEVKNRLHLRFMWSVLTKEDWRLDSQRTKDLQKLKTKKIAYSFSMGSTGDLSLDCDMITTFVIAKKHPKECGILFPNPYFNDLSVWKEEMSELLKIADQRHWELRTHKLFWRGQLTAQGTPTSCDGASGKFARLSALTLSSTNPNFFDIKAIECTMEWNSTYCSHIYNYTRDEIEAMRHCSRLIGKEYVHEKFSRFSMFLDLPGGSRGSYSRNLNHLWLMGGVVFIWTGPMMEKEGAEQWYFPALKDKHTHRIINRETAKSVVLHVLNNSKERKHLVANARGVANHFLCAHCQVEYVVTALTRVQQSMSAFSTLLNNPDHSQTKEMKQILKELCLQQKWVKIEGLDEEDPPKHIIFSNGKELCQKLKPSPNQDNFNFFEYFFE